VIKAEVLADSIHAVTGSRLSSLKLVYPRMIHSEFMTHRVISKNSASSRAIPTKRFRRDVLTNLAKPTQWDVNGPGMQGHGKISGVKSTVLDVLWAGAALCAVFMHFLMEKVGVHKQQANRILEPFFHMTVIATATDAGWNSFLALRDHPAADPTIRALAVAVREALDASEPAKLALGEAHLPFKPASDCKSLKQKFQSVVARCARVSYAVFGSTRPSMAEEDIDLYNRLAVAKPPHASPMEHVAFASVPNNTDGGNFGSTGWSQYRKQLGV